MSSLFDVAIIGAGPCGLSAAINAASEGLKTAVIDANSKIGGQSRFSAAIENYAGFPKITGEMLANRMESQARKFNVNLCVRSYVNTIETDGKDKVLSVNSAGGVSTLAAKSVVIASGVQWNRIDAGNFDAQVLYGGNKDLAHLYKGKNVLVLGGGNSAGQAAIQWSRFANVTLVARHGLSETMSEYLVSRLRENPVKVIEGQQIEQLQGNSKLESCKLSAHQIACDLVIPFIGSAPKTDFAKLVCACDEHGYLIDSKVDGVFIGGDCRKGSVKRIAAAVGEGSSLVSRVHSYLRERSL